MTRGKLPVVYDNTLPPAVAVVVKAGLNRGSVEYMIVKPDWLVAGTDQFTVMVAFLLFLSAELAKTLVGAAGTDTDRLIVLEGL